MPPAEPTIPWTFKAACSGAMSLTPLALMVPTVIVLAEAPKSMRPTKVLVVPTLEDVAVTPLEPIVNTPVEPNPVVETVEKDCTVGFPVPPILLRTKPACVLSPK